MKKTILLLAFILPHFIYSQNEKEQIQSYLNSNKTNLGLTSQDITDWVIESKATSKRTKIDNYYIKQRSNGIEIYQALSNIWIKNNEVIHIGNRFVKNANQKTNAINPQITVLDALASIKNQLGINDAFVNKIISAEDTKSFVISNVPKANKIKAKLVYQSKDNKLLLAWHFVIGVPSQNHVWNVRISAIDGTIIEKKDMMISCQFDDEKKMSPDLNFYFNKRGYKERNSVLETQAGAYRVIPYNIESPNHGPRQLISSPADVTASPFGWHDDNGVVGADYTITEGNNVYAFEDTADFDEGASPDGGATLTFDYPYLGTNTNAFSSVNAATTNLFYMNNIMHDVFYHYGFDEENGNFQWNNYNNPGDGFDNVWAESQDGGGFNNANFYPPIDGENGVMQMYLWDRKPATNIITVTAPASFSGNYLAFESNFVYDDIRLPIAPAFLSGNLVLVNDGEDDPTDACSAIINTTALNGNIALIKRGSCYSVDKIVNAQEAGATAVIIFSDLPGNLVVGGYGNDQLTIPVISIKKEEADLFLNTLATNPMQVKLSSPISDFVNVDGDFDNLVIAHEYGHGISTRLTGGRLDSDCLDNDEQMGEGWSDWFGLMMQLKSGDNGEQSRGIGTFVTNEPITDVGIRSYPYTTNMVVNPFTFASTNTAVIPHGLGSVWATMLWDLTWAYVAKYGFDPNIYTGNGGNNKLLQVVVDALKLQPCSPSFVDGRDAILAADEAITGGQDYCLIWQVFARRGLGFNASSGDSFSSTDQIEDFSVPSPGPNCTLGIDYFQNEDLITVYPNPSNGIINLKINQYSGMVNYQVFDINGRKIIEQANYEFLNESQINLGSIQSGVYMIKINTATASTTKKLIIR